MAAVYLALAVVGSVLVAVGNSGPHDANSAANALGGFVFIFLAIAGCVHTLAIRDQYGRALASQDDPRLEAAEHRVQERARALRICAEDPQRAKQLGIGRPDLSGSFDAGLLDINHAGAGALVTLPGIDHAAAEKIISLRDGGAGFASLADLDLVLDLPEGRLQDLKERVIFLPR